MDFIRFMGGVIIKKVIYIYYIISFLLFLGFVILIVNAYSNVSQTVSTTVNNKTPIIVIDAGHGGEDGGATANNIIEKDINLSIAKKLEMIFTSNGYEVIMTRTDDNSIGVKDTTIREQKVSDMKKRLEIYNSNKENIVISIHQNKFQQEKYNGTQIFYSTNNEKSSILAENIKTSVVNLLQPNNTRECKKATKEIYLLYNSKVPSVIVECGFLSNKNEAEKLKTDSYQKQLAFTIYLGVSNYINQI